MADESGIATAVSQHIADRVLGATLDKLTDPVLSAFGLGGGGSDSDEAYFNQVFAALDKIQVTVDDLSKRMAEISEQVAAVQKAETAISMQIQDSELQTALQFYTSDANLIEQKFLTYSNVLAAMKDEESVKDALRDLRQLFSVNEVDAVAVATCRHTGGASASGFAAASSNCA